MQPLPPGRSLLPPLLGSAVVGLTTIQLVRLFVPGLWFGLGEARSVPPVVVGVVGLAVMMLTLLGLTLSRSLNRSVVIRLAALLVTIRLFAQVIEAPTMLLALAGIGVVAGGLTIPALAVVYGGRAAGLGLVLGAAGDVAIMTGRHTLDLVHGEGTGALLVTAGIAIIGLGSLLAEAQMVGPPRSGPSFPGAAAFAVGPWLAIHVTVTGNHGFVASVSGVSTVVAGGVCALGAAFALAWAAPGRTTPPPAPAALVATLSLFGLASADGGWAAFLVVVTSVAAGGALTSLFQRETTAPPERVGWGAGLGMVVGFALVTLYYLPLTGVGPDASGSLLIWFGVPLLAAGVVGMTLRPAPAITWVTPAVVGLLLAVVPASVALNDEPFEQAVGADDQPFILTYNLNHGFDAEGRLALESMARVIESADADIIAVQEVSRGWVATGGVDMVGWLEWRLGLPVVFGPTADRQWGVAAATALPVVNPMTVELGSGDEQVERAALDVPIEVRPGVRLRVLVVQLHQTLADTAVRQVQAGDLLAAWGGADRTVLAGDLGGGPTDPAVVDLLMGGLRDPARIVEDSPATWPADDPVRQHDFVLISPDLGVAAARVLPFAASDHLAFMVRVVMPEAAE